MDVELELWSTRSPEQDGDLVIIDQILSELDPNDVANVDEFIHHSSSATSTNTSSTIDSLVGGGTPGSSRCSPSDLMNETDLISQQDPNGGCDSIKSISGGRNGLIIAGGHDLNDQLEHFHDDQHHHHHLPYQSHLNQQHHHQHHYHNHHDQAMDAEHMQHLDDMHHNTFEAPRNQQMYSQYDDQTTSLIIQPSNQLQQQQQQQNIFLHNQQQQVENLNISQYNLKQQQQQQTQSNNIYSQYSNQALFSNNSTPSANLHPFINSPAFKTINSDDQATTTTTTFVLTTPPPPPAEHFGAAAPSDHDDELIGERRNEQRQFSEKNSDQLLVEPVLRNIKQEPLVYNDDDDCLFSQQLVESSERCETSSYLIKDESHLPLITRHDHCYLYASSSGIGSGTSSPPNSSSSPSSSSPTQSLEDQPAPASSHFAQPGSATNDLTQDDDKSTEQLGNKKQAVNKKQQQRKRPSCNDDDDHCDNKSSQKRPRGATSEPDKSKQARNRSKTNAATSGCQAAADPSSKSTEDVKNRQRPTPSGKASSRKTALAAKSGNPKTKNLAEDQFEATGSPSSSSSGCSSSSTLSNDFCTTTTTSNHHDQSRLAEENVDQNNNNSASASSSASSSTAAHDQSSSEEAKLDSKQKVIGAKGNNKKSAPKGQPQKQAPAANCSNTGKPVKPEFGANLSAQSRRKLSLLSSCLISNKTTDNETASSSSSSSSSGVTSPCSLATTSPSPTATQTSCSTTKSVLFFEAPGQSQSSTLAADKVDADGSSNGRIAIRLHSPLISQPAAAAAATKPVAGAAAPSLVSLGASLIWVPNLNQTQNQSNQSSAQSSYCISSSDTTSEPKQQTDSAQDNHDKKQSCGLDEARSKQLNSPTLGLISSQDLKTAPKGQLVALTEEERRTHIAEGYPIPQRFPLTKLEERNLKKVRRKIKNKISAQESRRKKKELMDELKKRVLQLEKQIKELEQRNSLLELRNQQLVMSNGANSESSLSSASSQASVVERQHAPNMNAARVLISSVNIRAQADDNDQHELSMIFDDADDEHHKNTTMTACK